MHCALPLEDCRDAFGVARLNGSAAFTELEQGHIQSAAHRWNLFAGHEVVTVRTRRDSLFCTIVSETEPIAENVQGRFMGLTGTIRIGPSFRCSADKPEERDPQCFEALVMHEMGHLLGLDHLPAGASGIMQPAGAALDFSEADRNACRAAGICLSGEL